MHPRTKRGFRNVDQWVHMTGGRPHLAIPNSKWLQGPFYFRFTFDALGNETNLITSAITTSDPQVDAAYGTSDVPKAIMRLGGVQLWMNDDAFRLAGDDIKQILFEDTVLRIKDGTTTQKWNLGQTAEEPWEDVTLATAADIQYLKGMGPYILPQPVEVNLETDEFAIDPGALGTAFTAVLKVWGYIFPNDSLRDPRMDGVGSGRCTQAQGLDPTQHAEVTIAQMEIGAPNIQRSALKRYLS